VTVYHWQPGSDLEAIGNLYPGLAKPSHILIDRIDDDHHLVVLDNTARPDHTKLGTEFRAHSTDIFSSGTPGSMNLSAFQVGPPAQ
jgi:hypothetical protein